ncbi:hypothetical protein KDK77_01165 [bacterium]|nr:hypothetical protein [bacterium]MCP5461807.1 hypothetical protein [bacterium]
MYVKILNKKIFDKIGFFAPLLSVLFCLVLTLKVSGGNILASGDSAWHYSNEAHLLRSLEDGQGIFGCFTKGVGHPLLNFYQPLLYILVVGIHLLSFKLFGLIAIHNLLVCILFSLFPLAIYYMGRSFRCSQFESGCMAVFAVFPISGWGHTLDAYFWIGLHTQVIGAVCLPLFLGAVHRMVWHPNRWRQCCTAVFALAALILGHAVFALLVMLALAVYVAIFFIIRGTRECMRLIKPLACCLAITGTICSFWIVPFVVSNHTYKFIPESERSFSPLTVSLTPGQLLSSIIGGDLFDTVNVSSPLFGGGEEGFRWSMNDAFKRFRLFTCFILFGLVCAFLSKRKFGQLYFAGLFSCSCILFCGKDDFPLLHLLPFSRNFQPIRAMYLIELASIVLAGYSFAWVVKKVSRSTLIACPLCRYFGVAVLCSVLCIPLYERYRIASLMVRTDTSSQTEELRKLCSVITPIPSGKRVYYGKSTGATDISLRALADFYFLNNVCGHDNAMGGSIAWLANETQNRLPYFPPALSLFNVEHLIADASWNPAVHGGLSAESYLDEKWKGNFFSVQQIKDSGNFFFAYPQKPVMVWCDVHTWYYLNREWLSLFFVHGFKIAPLVKAPKNFEQFLSTDSIAGFIALDFSAENRKKQKYRDAMMRFQAQGGVIASNRPLGFDGIKKIIPGNNAVFEEMLIKSQPCNDSVRIQPETDAWYQHTAQIEANTAQFIIAKTAYYKQWKAYQNAVQCQTFSISPGFVGLFVSPESSRILLKYQAMPLHRWLWYAAFSLIVGCVLMRRTIKKVLNKKKQRGRYYHFRGIKLYRYVVKGIVLFGILWVIVLAANELIFSQVSLIYPYCNQKNGNPYEMVFRWNKLNESVLYDFQLSDKKSFEHIIFQVEDVTDNHLGYRGLKPYMRYYWRVRAGNGKWSAARSFKTGSYFPIALR